MLVQHGGRSDVGVVRPHNEDAFLIEPSLQLFAVCDGVGGRLGGAEASRLATEHISHMVGRQRRQIDDFVEGTGTATRRDVGLVLEQSISDASRRVRHAAMQNPQLAGMATTVASVLVAGNHAFVAHVGDSRVYLLRSRVLHLLTEDHSLMNDMRRRGRAMERGSIAAGYQEALTRALGLLDTARVDMLDLEVMPGDRFVLCSDGVHGVVGDEMMQAIVAEGSPQEAADELIEAALQKGAPDNATAVVVELMDNAAGDRAARLRRRLEAIQGVTIFRYLPFADLMRVAGIATEQVISGGADIFVDGEQGDKMYIVLAGEVSVRKQEVELAILKAGAHFGEMALIERAPRSATVRAKGHVEVLVFDREGFFGLLSDEGAAVKLLWGMVRMLNARLKHTSDELTALKSPTR